MVNNHSVSLSTVISNSSVQYGRCATYIARIFVFAEARFRAKRILAERNLRERILKHSA